MDKIFKYNYQIGDKIVTNNDVEIELAEKTSNNTMIFNVINSGYIKYGSCMGFNHKKTEEKYLKHNILNLAKKHTLLFVLSNGENVILFNDCLINILGNKYASITKYSDRLESNFRNYEDVKKIYTTTNNSFELIQENLVWKRTEIKKLTHKEIENFIGENFELVDKNKPEKNLKKRFFDLATKENLVFETSENQFVIISGKQMHYNSNLYANIDNYNNQLTFYEDFHKIDRIYKLKNNSTLGNIFKGDFHADLIWERLPKYTLDELIEKVGYEFEYIK